MPRKKASDDEELEDRPSGLTLQPIEDLIRKLSDRFSKEVVIETER